MDESTSCQERMNENTRSDFKSVYGKDWLTTGGTGITGMKKMKDYCTPSSSP